MCVFIVISATDQLCSSVFNCCLLWGGLGLPVESAAGPCNAWWPWSVGGCSVCLQQTEMGFCTFYELNLIRMSKASSKSGDQGKACMKSGRKLPVKWRENPPRTFALSSRVTQSSFFCLGHVGVACSYLVPLHTFSGSDLSCRSVWLSKKVCSVRSVPRG